MSRALAWWCRLFGESRGPDGWPCGDKANVVNAVIGVHWLIVRIFTYRYWCFGHSSSFVGVVASTITRSLHMDTWCSNIVELYLLKTEELKTERASAPEPGDWWIAGEQFQRDDVWLHNDCKLRFILRTRTAYYYLSLMYWLLCRYLVLTSFIVNGT